MNMQSKPDADFIATVRRQDMQEAKIKDLMKETGVGWGTAHAYLEAEGWRYHDALTSLRGNQEADAEKGQR